MRSKNKNCYSNSRIIYLVLLLITAIAIGMPFFPAQYIIPSFEKHLLDDTKNEAVRTGKHLMRTILESHSGGKFVISDEITIYLDHTYKDLNLWKIKIFSNTGETIYSTSKEEIGVINENKYFQNIVSKGKIYTKVVGKNTRSLENQIVNADVVETYVPIMNKGHFLGAFELYYDITVHKKSMDALISQFYLLIKISAIMLINAAVLILVIFRDSIKERQRFEHTLLKIAKTDELTGLYNRRGFEELLQWEYRKVERYNHKACILLFDLDHFKKINDTYGHQAGDDVLITVAQKCKNELRKTDILGRYGGEEFIALLTDTDRVGALKVAEKLRRTIESTLISTTEGTINLTISIGVASFGDKHLLSIDRVIKYADDSLYIAKKNGRNQVSCAEVNTYIERGNAYVRKGQYDKAISDYSKAIEINPTYASAYTYRGSAYGRKGQHDKAISDYNKAIEINPRLAKAYNYRGTAYSSKGKYDKAISDHNKAIEISPRYAEAYFNRGFVYSSKGKYDKAISDYNKAIEISPRYAEAYTKRRRAYYFKKEYGNVWKDTTMIDELPTRRRP